MRRTQRVGKSRRGKRRSRRQRGGMRTPIPQRFWNGAPKDDECKTLVYRRSDPSDRHGSPYALVPLCDVIDKEGQFAT